MIFKKIKSLPFDLNLGKVEPKQGLDFYPTSSALAIYLVTDRPNRLSHQGRSGSAILNWMNKRRLSLVMLACLLVFLGLAAISTRFLTVNSLPISQSQGMAGMALRYYAEGKFEKALSVYEEMVDHNSANDIIYLRLANCHFKMKNWEKAEQFYQMALNKEEEFPQAQINLALSKYNLKKFEEARDLYQSFIDNYSERFPRLTKRAKLSIRLMREQGHLPENDS